MPLTRADILALPGVDTLVVASHFPFHGNTLGTFSSNPGNSACMARLAAARKKEIPNLYARVLRDLSALEALLPPQEGTPPIELPPSSSTALVLPSQLTHQPLVAPHGQAPPIVGWRGRLVAARKLVACTPWWCAILALFCLTPRLVIAVVFLWMRQTGGQVMWEVLNMLRSLEGSILEQVTTTTASVVEDPRNTSYLLGTGLFLVLLRVLAPSVPHPPAQG